MPYRLLYRLVARVFAKTQNFTKLGRNEVRLAHKVRLLKQVKDAVNERWIMVPALYDSKNRIRVNHVWLNGQDEVHAEGTYQLEWRSEGKRFRQAAGPDAWIAEEARAKKEAELKAIAHGLLDAPAATTESVTIENAVASYLAIERRPVTTGRYRQILTGFSAFVTKPTRRRSTIDEITREDLIEFGSALRTAGNGPHTISDKLTIVNQMLMSASGEGLLKKGDRPKYNVPIRPMYEHEELAKLFRACNETEAMRFNFFLNSGFREAEVQFLTWRDLNFASLPAYAKVTAKPHWKFLPKNYEERKTPIPQALVKALKLYRPENAKPDDLVFPNPVGHPDSVMLSRLKKIAYRAKLNCGHCLTEYGYRCAEGPNCRRWGLHKFRHTYASLKVHEGIDPRTLQQWMGHRDLNSTLIYFKGQQDKALLKQINQSTTTAYL